MTNNRWGPTTAPKLLAIHGFADEGTAFARLGRSTLTEHFELIAPDLPGFGGMPLPEKFDPTIAGYSAFIIDLADQVSPDAPAGLIAHSVGSVIAVEAARKCPDRISSLMSIEGNLTAEDAYFSGQAADFETPEAFKPHIEAHIAAMAEADPKLGRYSAAARRADATAMWRLGRDAARQGNLVGDAYLKLESLNVTTLYYWGRHNTPAQTAAFIDAHRQINAREFSDAGHWVFEDASEETARIAREFFEARF